MQRRSTLALALGAGLALAGCKTDDADDWAHIGPGTTEFRQADRTCEDQLQFVADESERTEFYVKCMAALGWAPRTGATIEI